MASPFRINVDWNGKPDPDGRKQLYRWPPGPQESQPQKLYERVTSVIGAGEPQPWMKAWVSKLIVDYIVDRSSMRSIDLLGTSEFELWWFDVLAKAERSDERLILKKKTPYFVKGLMKLTPEEQLTKFLKALPDIKRDEAANIGTYAHKLAEEIQQGRSVEVPSHMQGHVDSTLAFLNDFQPKFLHVEGACYSDTYGYAGMFDWIAEIDGKITLGDYKTSAKGIKSSTALQLAAYAGSDFIGTEDGNKLIWGKDVPFIEQYVGVNLRTDGYDVIPINVTDQTWADFLAVREVAGWIKERSPKILGKPLSPPKRVAA